jgi:hypothetical protein
MKITIQVKSQSKEVDIKLREVLGQVNLIVDRQAVKGSSEYRTTAEYTQRTYGLSDSQMMELYHDYREDYDNQQA